MALEAGPRSRLRLILYPINPFEPATPSTMCPYGLRSRSCGRFHTSIDALDNFEPKTYYLALSRPFVEER